MVCFILCLFCLVFSCLFQLYAGNLFCSLRTLAMTVYGDLDVSVIDELPPGRKPVATVLRYDEPRAKVMEAVRRQLDAGHQVYIVYPLVKENEKLDLRSVEEGFAKAEKYFAPYKVALVHGQLKPAVKDEIGRAHV